MLETLPHDLSPWVRPPGYVAVQYVRPKRPPRLRDSQRQRVYDFEREVIGHGDRLSLDDCAALAAEACALYLLHPVAVKDGRGRRHACAVRDVAIKLPRWSRVPEVVLHEVAHCVVHHYLRCEYGPGAAGHGPEFVRVFVDLLETVLGFNAADLADQARARGLQVAEAGAITQAPAPVVGRFLAGPSPTKGEAPDREWMSAKLRWSRDLRAVKGYYVCRDYVPALDLRPPHDRPWGIRNG